MPKITTRLLLVLGFLIAHSVGYAATEQKIALVIGNDKYLNVADLSNPVRDARLVRSSLESIGFDVISLENAKRRDINKSVKQFRRKLKTASLGFVYYAGHAVQIEGQNYLLPVDIAGDLDEVDVPDYAYGLNRLLTHMQKHRDVGKIVVLDACRNNPFQYQTRGAGGTRGLATAPARFSGTYIAYATAAGDVAVDGPPGGNSPYAASLAKHLTVPGLLVQQVFSRVASDVWTSTNGEQEPWVSASIRGDYYLAGRERSEMPSGSNEAPLTIDVEKERLEAENQRLKEELEKQRLEAEEVGRQTQDVAVIEADRPSIPKNTNTTPALTTSPVFGSWQGEISKNYSFPRYITIRFYGKSGTGFLGTASLTGEIASAGDNKMPECNDAVVVLQHKSGNEYDITFVGKECNGKGKVKLKGDSLNGGAKFNATRFNIVLARLPE